MNRILAIAVIGILGLTGQASAATIAYTDFISFGAATAGLSLVEDFESVAPKDTALASIVSNGNTYTPVGAATNVWVSSPGYTNYGIPGATTTSILTATGDEDFTIDFGSPSTAVGFDTYLNGLGPASVSVYGLSGLLGTFPLTHLPTVIGFFGVTAMEPITQIRFTTTLGGRINTGIDNMYQGRAVPEPTTLLLLATGLAAVGYRRRRKQ